MILLHLDESGRAVDASESCGARGSRHGQRVFHLRGKLQLVYALRDQVVQALSDHLGVLSQRGDLEIVIVTLEKVLS